MELKGLGGYLPLERLLQRIHTINHFWKSRQEAQSDNKTNDSHGKYFRHMKLCYQVELIRREYPSIFLEIDQDVTLEETYSICLPKPIGNFKDGAHIPKRLAEEFLTREELSVLVRNYK